MLTQSSFWVHRKIYLGIYRATLEYFLFAVDSNQDISLHFLQVLSIDMKAYKLCLPHYLLWHYLHYLILHTLQVQNLQFSVNYCNRSYFLQHLNSIGPLTCCPHNNSKGEYPRLDDGISLRANNSASKYISHCFGCSEHILQSIFLIKPLYFSTNPLQIG